MKQSTRTVPIKTNSKSIEYSSAAECAENTRILLGIRSKAGNLKERNFIRKNWGDKGRYSDSWKKVIMSYG